MGPNSYGAAWGEGVEATRPEGAEVLHPPALQGDCCFPESLEAPLVGEVAGAAVGCFRDSLKWEDDEVVRGVIAGECLVEEVLLAVAFLVVLLAPLPHLVHGLADIRLAAAEVVDDVDPAGGAEEAGGAAEVGGGIAWGGCSEAEDALQTRLPPRLPVPTDLQPGAPWVPVDVGLGCVAFVGAADVGVLVPRLWYWEGPRIFDAVWLLPLSIGGVRRAAAFAGGG